ncbi:MAG: ethylbenzene dehydrogenase-related protein [Candidatus Kariarchaeaceae archaeon]
MKKTFVAGLTIVLLIAGIQVSFLVDSFPGFHSQGDCTLCHNNPAFAYNSSMMDEGIVLDGLEGDDLFWEDHLTQYRRTYVPVGGAFGSAHTFVKTIFGQNSTHIFMLIGWEDATIDGTDTERYADSDGISIMWNINMDDFDTGYGMKAAREEGELVDMVTWKPAASEDGQQLYQNDYTPKAIEGNIYDAAYDHSGWEDDATNDWMAAAVHGNVSNHNEHNYQIELVRPLVTADSMDVQFDESKYYQFGFAIYNDTSGNDHWISPVHSVFVYNPDDPDMGDIATVTQQVTETNEVTVTETATETQVETEAKSPFLILPFIMALITIPSVVIIRRKL